MTNNAPIISYLYCINISVRLLVDAELDVDVVDVELPVVWVVVGVVVPVVEVVLPVVVFVVVVPVVEVVLPVVVFVVELCINTHCPLTRLYPVGQEVCLLITIGMHPWPLGLGSYPVGQEVCMGTHTLPINCVPNGQPNREVHVVDFFRQVPLL